MAVFEDIDKAFIGIMVDNDFSMPVAFENVFFDETEITQKNYLSCFLLPVPTVQATLGDEGCDNHRGLFQIDILFDSLKGSHLLTQKADEINAVIKSGATFTHNSLNVRIQNVSRQRLTVSDGLARLTMTIEYFAFNKRL